jgi:hypothetical protein
MAQHSVPEGQQPENLNLQGLLKECRRGIDDAEGGYIDRHRKNCWRELVRRVEEMRP